MKKFIPFLVSGMLVVGTFGCSGTNESASETPSDTTTNSEVVPPSAQEASSSVEDKNKPAAVPGTDAVKDTAIDPATDPAAVDGAEVTGNKLVTNEVSKALKEKLPASNLEVTEKEGVITVSGTVSSEEEQKEIEPIVNQLKGVKGVNIDVKVESAPAE
ncbi:MAG: BON domain-containing protein [Cyanobacteria bacterium P01_A01_bin.84]